MEALDRKVSGGPSAIGYASVVVVGIGLLIRILHLAEVARTPLSGDPLGYFKMAQQLYQGVSFSPYWPPGLPYYLSFVCRFVSQSEFAARASILLFYPVSAFILFRMTAELATRRAALFATVVFALYPTFIHLSVEPVTETPTATCLLLTCYLMMSLRRHPSWVLAVLCGGALGWLVLIRPSSLLLIPVVAYVLARQTRKLTIACVPALIAVALCGAWLLKAYNLSGHFVMINTANGLNMYFGNNPYTPLYRTWWFGSHSKDEAGVPEGFKDLHQRIGQHPEAERNRLYQQVALRHIASRPDLFLLRTVNRVRAYFAFNTTTGVILIGNYKWPRILGLCVIGVDTVLFVAALALAITWFFTRGFPSGIHDGYMTLFLMMLTYTVPYWLSFAHPRLHVPIVPLLLVPAAATFDRLLSGPASSTLESIINSPRRRLGWILAIALVVYIQIEWIFMMWFRISSIS